MRAGLILICVLCFTLFCSAPPRRKRIVEGWNAVNGQFGFMVSIRNSMNAHFCGGTILNPTTILTAAHCVYNYDLRDASIVAGSDYLSKGGDFYAVKETIYHENFDPVSMLDDIAIIKTKTPIIFNQNVTWTVLASERTPDDDTVMFGGWGGTNGLGTIDPDRLQYVHLLKLYLEACARYPNAQGRPLRDTHVCTASHEGGGACMGDSGGPLVNYDYHVIGVLSWGSYPCGGIPDVFTRVAAYKDWIAHYL